MIKFNVPSKQLKSPRALVHINVPLNDCNQSALRKLVFLLALNHEGLEHLQVPRFPRKEGDE